MSQPSTDTILLFDGDCAFCTTSAHWAQRALPQHPTIAPWQRVDLAAYGLTPEKCSTAVQWVHEGRVFSGEAAIDRLLQDAGGVWRAVGTAGAFPPGSWLAAATYRTVAKHRHRLPGGTPACRTDP